MREQFRFWMRGGGRLGIAGRLSPQALSRAVAAGLIIVVLAFTALSTGRTLVTARAFERMNVATTLGDAFAGAHNAADTEESLDRLYQLAPAPDVRRQHLDAATSLVASLLVVRQHGNAADIRLVDRVLLDHTTYLDASEQLYAAVDQGDVLLARTIHERSDDAELGNIADILGTAAAHHAAGELQARQELARTEHMVSIAAPVASALELAFAALIWTVIRMYQVRLDEAAQERVESAERAAEAVRQSEQRYRGIVETAQEGVWTVDTEAKTTFVNRRLAEMLGYTVDEMLGRSLFEFMEDGDRALVAGNLQRRREGIPAEFEFKFVDKGGSPVWTIVHASGLNDQAGAPSGALAMVTDIRIRKQAEADRERLQAELVHQAFYDSLTGLPNRALFLDRLEHAMLPSSRRQPSEAVLFLDLDNFKLVNDSLGHDAGDELLKVVAERLTSCVRPEDTVARLGGDEFTVLLEGLSRQKTVLVAQRVIETLSRPVVIDGHEILPRASIGIATRSNRGDTANKVLRNADLAMYKAKAAGRGRYALFDPEMNSEALGRLQLEAELRRAVEHSQFRIYYQPIVSMSDGSVAEVEALVRWQHPQRGLLSAEEFIPLAEETGLILPIGEWVLRQACRQVVAWERQRPGGEPVMLSVNLSARQFQHQSIVDIVRSALQNAGLAPSLLKLELTESTVMKDPAETAHVLQELRALGVQLAIDDFGTGYSSLGYLRAFHVDTLKVDRSFVEGLPHDEQAVALIRGVVALAKGLHLTVTGEGIETREQLISLQDSGCDLGQGFLYGRPIPAEATGKLLLGRSRRPGRAVLAPA